VLLQAGVPMVERDLIREPLDEAEIRALLRGQPASTLYSFRSPYNRALGIDPRNLTDDSLIAAMASESRLIRRPIVVIDGDVVAGPNRARLEEIARVHGKGSG